MAPDTGSAVALAGVRRTFGDVLAVDDLTFEVPRGTVTVLLGPNGAGKTTVVRLVTGALHSHGGAVRTLGLDPEVDAEGTEIRRRCGVVPARPALYDRLSGTDNLEYAAALFQVDPGLVQSRVADAARRFGISDALHLKVGGYSTGMRARLALARAVLHEPDLLLLDEPTAGLDPESARTVLGLIDEMAEDGKTVLMCTHLLLEAEGLADQVIVMDHGRAMVSGSPRELTRQYWPAARVILDADDPAVLDTARGLPFVRGVPAQRRRPGRPRARDRRPRSRRRPRRCRRPPHPRRAAGPQPRTAVLRHPPGERAVMSRTPKQGRPSWVIARTDLRQLLQARDFWLPLMIVALLFFVIIPTFLLLILGSVKDANLAKKLSDVVGSLPKDLQAKVHGQKGPASASYALAVYLFAPLAIIVPLTVSSAVGAHTIVGERERGSGEFLAHSPATERQIYLGKLMASLIPGYFTAAMGFLLYSLVVNLIVGPKLGGWFFPTTNWWVLMLWVLPPFIALALAVILAISARVSSAAAAQQASALATLPLIVIAYGVSSNTLFRGMGTAFAIGGLAWCGAIFALWRASKAVSRERLLGMGAT